MENTTKNLNKTLDKGKNIALNATSVAAKQVNKYGNLFDFGPFGSIFLSLAAIYVLYKICNSMFYSSFNFNNKIDFIIHSYYYWTIILTIMVIYVFIKNM
jgi:hypothetical protein